MITILLLALLLIAGLIIAIISIAAGAFIMFPIIDILVIVFIVRRLFRRLKRIRVNSRIVIND